MRQFGNVTESSTESSLPCRQTSCRIKPCAAPKRDFRLGDFAAVRAKGDDTHSYVCLWVKSDRPATDVEYGTNLSMEELAE